MAVFNFNLPIYLRLAKKEFKNKKIINKKTKIKSRKRCRTKVYTLSLNNYSQWKYELRNNLKKKFYEEIQPQIRLIREKLFERRRIKLEGPLELNLRLMPKSESCDLDNFTSVVTKFFLDALQEEKLLEDDNFNWVVSLKYRSGEVDKLNPRMEVELIEGVLR